MHGPEPFDRESCELFPLAVVGDHVAAPGEYALLVRMTSDFFGDEVSCSRRNGVVLL